MEIYIHSVDGSQPPILLTQHPAADHSPAWSPQGRKIAFISSRSGEEDVWLADLDQVENRFQNISRNRDTLEAHPSWSRDGRYLTWASAMPDGLQQIQMWDMEHPDDRARPVNSGDWSVWGPDGDAIIASLRTPNQDYLTSYDLRDTRLAMPIIALSGAVAGLSWGDVNLQEIPSSLFLPDAGVTLTPVWSPVLSSGEILPGNRYQIVPLEGVEAPFPMLHDRADESFNALRSRVSRDAGWDFLATLEQAYLPLTSPLAQGMVEDWLYTGRAFRFHTAPISADWVAVIREDFGSQTYWRVFVRTRFQDGTQGMPMTSQPWDFLARHSGDPWAYEQGGMREEIPAGYWLDFTRLAAAYGWGRQPALSTWRSAYSAARFNEYILAEGLDWFSAMLEIYPREALNTTTPVYSPTPSFTPTRTPTASRTLTRTPFPTRTPTLSPTPRPTRTPRPTNTPWPTVTPKSSNTPRWSPTPTPMPSLPV
jgi:TolB protein